MATWYTEFMDTSTPKIIRREILGILYESYLEDPLQMLTPTDITERGSVRIKELVSNAYYLHDLDLIELMVGYNPPLFAATRILPKGIELFEDREALDKLFPLGPALPSGDITQLIKLMLNLAEEADQTDLEGTQKVWLLRDVNRLRALLSVSEKEWDSEEILSTLHWLDGFFMEQENVPLPSLELIKTILHQKIL
jgi:hypothetical protein